MWLRSFRTRLLLSSALVGTALFSPLPNDAVLAQAVVIDGGQMLTVPRDQASPWIIPGDGTLVIGLASMGGLTVQDAGSVVRATTTTLGENAGSTGVLTVRGAGSRFESVRLHIGRRGTGALTIENGAVVDNDFFSELARFDGSVGTATVTGPGSSWHDRSITVGVEGTATLTISDGGLVTAEQADIGVFSSSSGTVTVTGTGSRWENSIRLEVGSSRGGAGTLNIEDGGVVTSGFTSLGSGVSTPGPGVNGRATVTGIGSRFETGSGLNIANGTAGTSILTIQNGGFVSSDLVRIAEVAGGTGIVNIGAEQGQTAVAPGFIETPRIQFRAGTGILNFNHTGTAHAFAPALFGPGALNHIVGTTIFTGDSSGFTGATDVTGGDFRINGTMGGLAQIGAGGTVSGSGALTGSVMVSAGGQVSPGDNGIGTLSVGSLALASGAHLNFELGAPGAVGGASSDLINVAGDLTLDGTLNIADAGGIGAGVYRLINYGGALNDNGLDFGALPGGLTPADLFLQTSVANQVNLISIAGAQLSFWDGAMPALYENGAVDGGSGAWRADGRAWTMSDGVLNGPYRPNPTFAIFQGAAGTVSVDNSAGAISVTGMQFVTNGYEVTGDQIALAGTNARIRVGDGTAAGAGTVATISSALTGSAALTKTDFGTLVLAGNNSYSGGTIVEQGTLRLGAAQRLADGGSVTVAGGAAFDLAGFDERTGSLSGAGSVVLGDGVLTTGSGTDSLFSGSISGPGGLTKQGAGALVLTGTNSFAGGTRIRAGSLQIGDGGTTGSIEGNVENDTSLIFNRSDMVTFGGSISGAGDLTKQGAGTLVLTGDSSPGFTGQANVMRGDLRINGALGGQAQVGAEGTVSGSGALAGPVLVSAGGQVSPGDNGIGTLSVESLILASGAHLNFELGTPDVVGGSANDLINVAGDLTLNGTLNIADAGGFGDGVYRLINYGGALNDNGLDFGVLPVGLTPADLFVQTSVANQVNLISNTGTRLSFWDGARPALHDNGAVDGGSGPWRADGRAWTMSDGVLNGPYRPNPTFAVFQGAAGTVAVDTSAGAISVTGMQFVTDGYEVTGDPIALAGSDAIIRVGDGTAAGAGTAATISSALTGSAALTKTDLGTLVLAGDNSYSGGTIVEQGTLRLGATQSLADSGSVTVAGGAVFDLDGFDETIGALSGAGNVALGDGVLTTGDATDTVFSGTISGAGGLIKLGAGALTLTQNNSFTGETTVNAGALFNNGVLASRTIVNTGLFGGVGSTGGLQANAGSTIAPGTGGIGTMTVAGDAAFNAGSTFAVDLAPDGSSDRLAVTGTTVIAGSGTNLQVTGAPGDYPLTNTYTVLTSEGGIDGQFASVQDNLPDIDLEAVYQPNAVQLRYFQTARLTSPKQIHPSAQAAALDASRLFSQTMRRRGGLYAGTNAQTRSFTSHASLPAGEAGQTRPFTSPALHNLAVWGAAMGETSKTASSGGTPGWDALTGGFAFGLEHRFEGFNGVAGIAGATTGTKVDSGASDADVNAWYAGAYGSAELGSLMLSGALSYGWQTYKFDRQVPVAGFASRARGKADGAAVTASGEAFYNLADPGASDGLRFGPLATIETVHSKRDGFTESGAGILNLTVAKEAAHQATSGLGLALGADRSFDGMRLSADVRVAWEHVFGDKAVVASSAIPVAGATFATSSAATDRDRVAVGLGGALHVSEHVSAHIRYDGSYSGSSTDHSGAAGVTFRF